jgi:hypothetical protein
MQQQHRRRHYRCAFNKEGGLNVFCEFVRLNTFSQDIHLFLRHLVRVPASPNRTIVPRGHRTAGDLDSPYVDPCKRTCLMCNYPSYLNELIHPVSGAALARLKREQRHHLGPQRCCAHQTTRAIRLLYTFGPSRHHTTVEFTRCAWRIAMPSPIWSQHRRLDFSQITPGFSVPQDARASSSLSQRPFIAHLPRSIVVQDSFLFARPGSGSTDVADDVCE